MKAMNRVVKREVAKMKLKREILPRFPEAFYSRIKSLDFILKDHHEREVT